MNSVQSKKYGLSPDEIEIKSLSSERFRTLFNFYRIEKTKLFNNRVDRYDKKKYKAKRKKLRENSNVGEKVLVLAWPLFEFCPLGVLMSATVKLLQKN